MKVAGEAVECRPGSTRDKRCRDAPVSPATYLSEGTRR